MVDGQGHEVLPGIASGPRRRSSGTRLLASQFSSMIVASIVASGIVQLASMKHLCRSSRVTNAGASTRQFCSDSRSPQAAAWANIGAFWRTHIDLSDIAHTIGTGLRRRKLSSVTGNVELEDLYMANIS